MNKIFFKFAIIGCAMSLAGCSDFLDKEVEGYSTDKNFYDTQYKMQSALDAAYDVLQTDQLNNSDWRFGEACGDDVIGGDESLSSEMGQLVNFRFNNSNSWILKRWQIYYKGVHRANQVIYNIDRVHLSTDQYTAYQGIRQIYGQAKFLRAYYYFNLVRTFGGVPIRPESESVEKLVIPRSSRQECYDYIEKDLREAAVMLPAVYPAGEQGKATKGAAVALLMKVLMYESTPGQQSETWQEMKQLGDYMVGGKTMTYGQMLKYDGKEDWESLRKRLWFKPKELNSTSDPYETADTQLEAINNAYSLEYKDYYGSPLHNGDKNSYLFQFYKDGEFCKGSVFEIVFKESADGSSGDTNEGAGIDIYGGGSVYINNALLSEIFGSDIRKSFCIGHKTTTFDGQTWMGGEGKYVSLKWYTPKKDSPQYDGDNGRNRRILRYVDVVLMYAEALNECGERENALTQLNRCKAQVNTLNNGTSLYVAGGYGFIRDQIWKERRIELAFEWERFFDIVRQGRAYELMHEYSEMSSVQRGVSFEEKNNVFPIPQTEIDVSNNVVKQNPGY